MMMMKIQRKQITICFYFLLSSTIFFSLIFENKLTFSACIEFRLFDELVVDVIDESDKYDELLDVEAGDEADKKLRDEADSGEMECNEAKSMLVRVS